MTFSRRLRQRYWRESTFKGVEMVRSALDEAYGAGKVSLVSAAFRWLNHHSQMKPECNGEWERMDVLTNCILFISCTLDAIIIGANNRDHLVTNLDACEEGPLDERKCQLVWILSGSLCTDIDRKIDR